MASPSPTSDSFSDNIVLRELERLRIALSVDRAIVYDWSLADDGIVWDDQVLSVLNIESQDRISSGAKFKAFLNSDGIALRDNLESNPSTDFSSFHIEYKFSVESDETCWLEDIGRRLLDDDGNPVRVIGILRVITDRKVREEHFSYLASYDELTGHLNRARLLERLGHTIHLIAAQRGCGAYMVAAIDDLAGINADYGFDVADEVIAGIGEPVRNALNATDQIGRTAGNKFGIIVADCAKQGMLPLAQSLVDAVHDLVIETTGGSVPVSISIGCVELTENIGDIQEVMTGAEDALDKAKRSGRGRVEAFNRSHEIESIRRSNAIIADRVVSALNGRRICLAHQPIVCAKTHAIRGYESLIRMIDEDGEIVQAGSFVPQAEQLGLIRLLDRRALELVTDILHKNSDLHLSLNVSGITATETLCVEGYLAYIEANRELAPRMTVELTETSAIRDMEESVRFVSRLRELGCRVAIDDFGAGYTSFRNLQELVVDCVKIDGSFIRGLADNEDNQLFVRTLVDLARNFGLETVAEYVNSRQEADMLRDYGVDYLQGFYFGEPAFELDYQVAPTEVLSKKMA